MDKEVIVRFIEWTKVKIRLHASEREVYFQQGEIWWASLGANIGHEQDGKHENFERPILVLKKFNRHVLWALALTSKCKEHNPYYYHYERMGRKYAVILTQLRLISSKRLLRKIGRIPLAYYRTIQEHIKNLI